MRPIGNKKWKLLHSSFFAWTLRINVPITIDTSYKHLLRFKKSQRIEPRSGNERVINYDERRHISYSVSFLRSRRRSAIFHIMDERCCHVSDVLHDLVWILHWRCGFCCRLGLRIWYIHMLFPTNIIYVKKVCTYVWLHYLLLHH